MEKTEIIDASKVNAYLIGKGRFSRKLSDTHWEIIGNPPIYNDVTVTIGAGCIIFSCDKPAVEEFYADECKRYQLKK